MQNPGRGYKLISCNLSKGIKKIFSPFQIRKQIGSYNFTNESVYPELLLVLLCIGFLLTLGCVSESSTEGRLINTTGSSNITVIDSTNTTWSFSHPAERIVALNLDTIETLVILGAGDNVVGVPESILTKTNLIDYLPHAVSVGESGSPNIELITSLHPDVIVIMSTAGEKEKSQFSNLNVPILSFNCYILSEIPLSVKNLGVLTGTTQNASSYLEFFHTNDDLIQKRITGSNRENNLKVYLETGSDFTAVGKGSGGDSLLSNIRANNVASDLQVQYPKVTPEWLVKTDPEYIIKSVHTYVGEEKNFTQIHSDIIKRPGFSEINACKNNQVYVITSNILYGPKGIIGQILLGKILYPELFSDITVENQIAQYENRFNIRIHENEIIYPPL